MSPSDSASGGLRWILAATVVAGGLGYVVQVAAPALIRDGASYVTFSVIWSAIYLCVSAMSGVQQEVTRASRRSESHPPNTVLRRFTLFAAAAVVAASLILAFALQASSHSDSVLLLATVLGVALTGYLLVAVLGGVLYGLHLWRAVALLTIVDAALRAALLLVGFWAQAPTTLLAFGIAVPFGLAFCIVWLLVRGQVVGRFALDVPLGRLTRNVLSTVGAAACMGAMISGLPLLLGLTTSDESSAGMGAVIMAITLTRAPIVTPVIALQSFLISAVFREPRRSSRHAILRLIAIGGGLLVALALLAAAVGPWLIGFISAGKFSITPWLMGAIVLSAGLVALICVTGPALVAFRRHGANIAGWAVAALLTLACLWVPFDFTTRVTIAILLPPVAGLVVHAVALANGPATARTAAGDTPAAH